MPTTPDVVAAAAAGGEAVLIFALSAAGVIIVSLLGLVGWFARSRIKSRERYEETLEKRLAAGAKTMEALKISFEQLQTKFVEAMGDLLKESAFGEYRREHKVDHDRLEERMTALREAHAELRQDILGVGVKVDSSVQAMSHLVSRMVELKGASNEC